ncbi:CMP-N-acetylneuraminate-beta-galactosamide-alpha-2,3-sialyltransferase 4 isoform X3 [Alosa sapidissima]|uniref:CMP-N-acetylneuraminate-beta-galactosamide- alpha-2,3-sialyltransferase 4 isoform X3 n=1 Tax=Alosa sapidissima TaxID=34773 RepID=UPI001C08E71D|nr:CMP-N-acetylneuraminate-beta-galactosamide-alpha-2,3-sialyltransferase 4 isoform X3 [Alosa sapidissima]
MSLKAAKICLFAAWCIRLVPLVLLFVSYYCFNFYLQSNGGTIKAPAPTKSLCEEWMGQGKKWENLNFTITRKTDLFLQLEDFFWRQHLATLALPYGIKGSESLLLKILAVTANCKMPASIENLDCRTCAVIGNGFAIKNSSLGAAINKYDVVIRLNDAPVRGYEHDVGNKTTLRLFYPESAVYNPSLQNNPDTLLVLVPFKQQDLRWLKEILYDEKRVRKGFWKPPPQIWLGKTSQIRVLDPYFLHHTASKLLQIPLNPKGREKPVHPTTGILAVFIALNYCDVVHIAGFGYPEAKNQRQPIHYFGSNTMKSMKDSYHDLDHEAQTLRKLEEAGAILYLHPHS